jgi:uncharacterized membrane protein YdjX (TVP38/TMEM64 family)
MSVGEVPATPPAPRPRRRRGGRWKKVVLASVMLGGLAAFFALGGHRYLTLESLRENRAILLAYTERNFVTMLLLAFVVYVVATALSFPGGILMSFAVGFLFGRWIGTALVVVAASIGATLAFLSARYLFADAVRRRMGPRLKRMARRFEEDGFNYILFTRLVPAFPFWLMNLVPAFTPVKVRTFFTATAIGILPGSFVFVNVGESLSEIESAGDLVSGQTLMALGMLGVLSLAPIAWKRWRTRKRKEKHG